MDKVSLTSCLNNLIIKCQGFKFSWTIFTFQLEQTAFTQSINLTFTSLLIYTHSKSTFDSKFTFLPARDSSFSTRVFKPEFLQSNFVQSVCCTVTAYPFCLLMLTYIVGVQHTEVGFNTLSTSPRWSSTESNLSGWGSTHCAFHFFHCCNKTLNG